MKREVWGCTDNLTIQVAKIPVVLAGWTDFDGNLDYRLRAELMEAKLSDKARDFLDDYSIDLAKETSVLHVTGTLDAMKVTADGPLADQGDDDRQRLREAGRRFRERLFR